MRHILPLSLLFLAACPEQVEPQPNLNRVSRVVVSADGDVGAVVQGHNGFAFDLYAELLQSAGDDNVFYSPFSTTSALSMTMAGAEGTTKTEMMDVLGVSIDQGDWHTGLGDLTRDLSGDLDRGYTLHVANRIFGQSDYPWEQPFLDVCEIDYDAPLESWDFISDPDGGRERVNDWVAQQTEDRIKDLLPPGSVTTDSRMVLANAIYFLADWATPFDPEQTDDGDFTLLDSSSVTVPLMYLDTQEHEEHGVQIGRVGDVGVARLPYADDEVSMVLLVPDAMDGLAALEAELDADAYSTYLDSLNDGGGIIVMPRIELEYEVDLKQPMSNLGMSSAFDSSIADFTGMASSPEGEDLFIQGIFHKAFVSIDEHGTEAAAATGVVVGTESASPMVRADHPFLFVIQDDLTGAILFVGRVTDPS
jgi:serpin B